MKFARFGYLSVLPLALGPVAPYPCRQRRLRHQNARPKDPWEFDAPHQNNPPLEGIMDLRAQAQPENTSPQPEGN
jgi:hypothetical protein